MNSFDATMIYLFVFYIVLNNIINNINVWNGHFSDRKVFILFCGGYYNGTHKRSRFSGGFSGNFISRTELLGLNILEFSISGNLDVIK